LAGSRKLIDVEAFFINKEAVLDVAENGVKPLHPIDHLQLCGLTLFSRWFLSEEEQRERIILENAVDQLLFFGDGPDQLSLVLPVNDQRAVPVRAIEGLDADPLRGNGHLVSAIRLLRRAAILADILQIPGAVIAIVSLLGRPRNKRRR
jgi:hypothetical protein